MSHSSVSLRVASCKTRMTTTCWASECMRLEPASGTPSSSAPRRPSELARACTRRSHRCGRCRCRTSCRSNPRQGTSGRRTSRRMKRTWSATVSEHRSRSSNPRGGRSRTKGFRRRSRRRYLLSRSKPSATVSERTWSATELGTTSSSAPRTSSELARARRRHSPQCGRCRCHTSYHSGPLQGTSGRSTSRRMKRTSCRRKMSCRTNSLSNRNCNSSPGSSSCARHSPNTGMCARSSSPGTHRRNCGRMKGFHSSSLRQCSLSRSKSSATVLEWTWSATGSASETASASTRHILRCRCRSRTSCRSSPCSLGSGRSTSGRRTPHMRLLNRAHIPTKCLVSASTPPRSGQRRRATTRAAATLRFRGGGAGIVLPRHLHPPLFPTRRIFR